MAVVREQSQFQPETSIVSPEQLSGSNSCLGWTHKRETYISARVFESPDRREQYQYPKPVQATVVNVHVVLIASLGTLFGHTEIRLGQPQNRVGDEPIRNRYRNHGPNVRGEARVVV